MDANARPMSELADLLRATRYESADPATLEEAEASRRLNTLHQVLAERSATCERQALVTPLRARR
jgi:hypothetical protein